MTYTEAVQLALEGNDRGFGFLYQNTYQSKLYLSLQYMKNESDAEDILQDAYVKAFSNLKNLKDPEKFSSWLGQIVANTAKNALVKKNPTLFTDMGTDEEESEPFEEQIPDEDVSNQPELSYTREETRQMVDDLIDSLSDEQRVCILMYHMEDMSIREIAETLDCSESTVKSRLNYGRKNLKAEAEELQKKGYKLYSLAPLALLTLLLHKDEEASYTEPSFLAAGRQVSTEVFEELPEVIQSESSGMEEAQPEENEARPVENETRPEGDEARPEVTGEAGEAEEAAEATGEGATVETGEETAEEAGEDAAEETAASGENAADAVGEEEAAAAGDAIEAELNTAEETGTAETGTSGAATEAEGTGATTSAGTPGAGTTAGAGAAKTGEATAAETGTTVEVGTAETGAAAQEGTAAETGAVGAGAAEETGTAGAGAAAKAGAGGAAKAGFFSTTAGRAIAIVAAVAVIGGAAFGISRLVQNNRNDVAEEEYSVQEEPAAAVPVPEAEEEAEEEPEEVVVTKDMYPDLLEGGLSEEQFEVALAYAPEEMENGEIDKNYLLSMINEICYDFPDLCFGGREEESSSEGPLSYYYITSLDSVNNFLSVLTGQKLSESDTQGWEGSINITGDTMDVSIYDGEWMTPYANITDAVLWEDSMVVTYEIRSTGTGGYYPEGTGTRSAVLTQTEDSRYRVNQIAQGTPEEIYHTERQMLLAVDEDGWTDERMYYDLVSLEGTNDAHQVINDGLEADYQAYLSYTERQTGMTTTQIEASDRVDFHQVGAGVSNIQDGVFSVRFRQLEMIEEESVLQYGLTYSLETGEQLGIRDLTDLSDEELLSRIKKALRDFVSDYPDPLKSTMESNINSYTLDDIGSGINFRNSGRISFCVQDDEIYILLPPAEFYNDIWANEAVPTGIYISGAEENEKEAGAEAEEETEDYGYDEDYIFPDSDSRYLSQSELVSLTDDELRIARNEIYARHGRKFSDPTLQAYFESKSWYNGTIGADDFDESVFNDYETANAKLIHDYEEER